MRVRLVMMLLALIFLCAAAATINYVLNSYGAWRTEVIDPIFREDNDPRVTTPYLVRTTEPRILLVGSSRVRVGMPIEQGYRDGFLNAALQGIDAEEAVAVVRVALQNPKLKTIVWGLDFFSFDENHGSDRATIARLRGDLWATFSETLFNLGALDAGRREFNRAWRGRRALRSGWTIPIPWPQAELCQTLDQADARGLASLGDERVRAQLVGDVPDYTDYRLSERKLRDYAEVVELAHNRGVQVIPFVPPISAYVLEMLRMSGKWAVFQRWKCELLTGGPYWDFSGYNDIALSPALFKDVMHFKPTVGFELLRRMLEMDTRECPAQMRMIDEAAFRVDCNTIRDVLVAQQKRLRAAVERDTIFTETTKKALIARGFSPNTLMTKSEEFVPVSGPCIASHAK